MKRTLNILAATVWYVGAAVLLWKGMALLGEAAQLRPQAMSTWLVAAAGLALGVWQGATIFRRNCQRNLARIAALDQPKPWQFFRPGFFLALALMIATGAILSRAAEGHYWPLVAVGSLDLLLAFSLTTSSLEFWRQEAFSAAPATAD